MKVEIVPATITHAMSIISTLRAREAESLERIGPDAKALLQQELVRSQAYAGLIDGEVVCLIGWRTGSLVSNSAYVWLLTTESVDEHAFIFVRYSQRMLEELKKEFSLIHGMVQADHARSIRWLTWLGFKLGPIETYGGVDVRSFELKCA